MTSTYSTSLRLELMATGDQSGTWGDTTNTNLGTLLEQAITGVLSLAMADANQTLTNLNGASDQARNAVIVATGALTAGRNIVVPAVNKVYLVRNSTTGGFGVTVKTPSGTGVTVANGASRLVYSDGTNVVDGQFGPLLPSSNDGGALGSASVAWSDLFLASGGVINWNNGNFTVTHSTGLLTFSGAIAGTTFNKVTVTAPATGSTLTIADGKTLTASNSLTLAGTDSTTMTFPSTTATIARTDAAQTFTGTQTFSGQIVPTGSIKNMPIAVFTPLQNQPPASNYATLSTRNSHAILQFDTTTQEAATFTGIMPYFYAAGDIRITIWATLATATTGTLGWDVAFENMNGQDIDSDGYAAAVTVTATTVPGTSGVPLVQQVTLTQAQADTLAAGDAFRLRLRRDVGSDTATGDAELLCMIVEMV